MLDTLKYYESLINAGNNELEAKAHVYSLVETLDNLVTKDDLHKELDSLDSRIGARLDTLRTLGWALFGAILLPLLKLAFWP